MRSAYSFTLLDAADADAVLAYEGAFHKAFSAVTGNRLIRWLWQWDDAAGRRATRIPYDDQIVYLQREADGEVSAALAVNVTLRECQANAFGFAMPDEHGLCEFLAFFVNDGHDLRTRYAFWANCFADLRRRGLQAAYATTARKPLGLYQRVGADVAATATIEGEERFFLRFSLDRDYIRRRTEADAA